MSAVGSSDSCFSGFVSYAWASQDLTRPLQELIDVRSRLLADISLEWWWDDAILVGQDWEQQIDLALKRADVGMFFVSVEMLASSYVMEKELPPFLNDPSKKLILVALDNVPEFIDQQGLTKFQTFRLRTSDGRRLCFADCDKQQRKEFANSLMGEIVLRLKESR